MKEKEEPEDKIHFNDLSGTLKLAVIAAWFYGFILAITIVVTVLFILFI